MKPKKIEIITDSTCDIPQALVERYGIKIIPQIIIWGEEQLRYRVDLTSEQFYRRLEKDRSVPSPHMPAQRTSSIYMKKKPPVYHERQSWEWNAELYPGCTQK
jgi:fatty acid-binding protein DegV